MRPRSHISFLFVFVVVCVCACGHFETFDTSYMRNCPHLSAYIQSVSQSPSPSQSHNLKVQPHVPQTGRVCYTQHKDAYKQTISKRKHSARAGRVDFRSPPQHAKQTNDPKTPNSPLQRTLSSNSRTLYSIHNSPYTNTHKTANQQKQQQHSK